jgi:hypothetical protein
MQINKKQLLDWCRKNKTNPQVNKFILDMFGLKTFAWIHSELRMEIVHYKQVSNPLEEEK